MTTQTAASQPAPATDPRAFKSFADFYPFYLSEHRNRTSRRLHFVGTSIGLVLLVTTLATQLWWLLEGSSRATRRDIFECPASERCLARDS